MTKNPRMHDVSALRMITFEPKRVCTSSWWIDQPRQHFTQVCAQMTEGRLLADDISDADFRSWQRRAALLATANGTAARVIRATA